MMPGRRSLTCEEIAEALQPHLPVPLPNREEFGKTLLTEIYDGLKRGDQVATIHVNPNGTLEISYITVGPRKDGKHNGILRGVTGR